MLKISKRGEVWHYAGTVLKYYAHARDDLTLTDAVFGPAPSEKIVLHAVK